MQDAVDIIPFPTVHRDNLESLEQTIINDVIISSDDKFIAAGTNNNLILIFKLSNQWSFFFYFVGYYADYSVQLVFDCAFCCILGNMSLSRN